MYFKDNRIGSEIVKLPKFISYNETNINYIVNVYKY